MSVCEHDPYCLGFGPAHDEAMALRTIREKSRELLSTGRLLSRGPKIENPIDHEPMLRDNAEYVEKIRVVRSNAKKRARSGNPAKRGPAVKVLGHVPGLLTAAYRKDASERMLGVSR